MAKRAFDIVVGTLLSLLVLPFVLLTAVALAVMFRAWPFFTQQRIGRRGEPFKVIKLRTLPPSAPRQVDKFQIQHLALPRLARFLRARHLDELPQLFLVVTGRMSLVGPRPEMLHLHYAGDGSFAQTRVSVRPGCAGLWQASVHSSLLIWDAPIYDLFYVEHTSMRLDLWILWRTLLVVLGVGRPITLVEVPGWARPTGRPPRLVAGPSGAAAVSYFDTSGSDSVSALRLDQMPAPAVVAER